MNQRYSGFPETFPARAVWKFPLRIADVQFVSIPKGARILSVQSQHNQLVMWALVDPSAEKEARTVHVLGTGHEKRVDIGEYVATAQTDDGCLVWHVFINPESAA